MIRPSAVRSVIARDLASPPPPFLIALSEFSGFSYLPPFILMRLLCLSSFIQPPDSAPNPRHPHAHLALPSRLFFRCHLLDLKVPPSLVLYHRIICFSTRSASSGGRPDPFRGDPALL
jgi:hypothetical protein